MVGWLVGWLVVGWLVGWLVGSLVDWLRKKNNEKLAACRIKGIMPHTVPHNA